MKNELDVVVSAKRLAADLRRELLTLKEGTFMGLEDEVLARLNVSRPTLRQAARVLEHEQLLSVRRGPRGGYYVTRPDAQSVISAASMYLYGRGTRLSDLVAAARGCVATLIRLAAMSEGEEGRDELRRMLEIYQTTDFTQLPHIVFLRAEADFVSTFAMMAGNAPLELVIKILYGCGLGVEADKIFENRPNRIATCAALRVQLVEAVLAGDSELAEIFDARASAMRSRYLTEDHATAAASEDAVQAILNGQEEATLP